MDEDQLVLVVSWHCQFIEGMDEARQLLIARRGHDIRKLWEFEQILVAPIQFQIGQPNNSHQHREAKIMGYVPHTTPLPVEGIVSFEDVPAIHRIHICFLSQIIQQSPCEKQLNKTEGRCRHSTGDSGVASKLHFLWGSIIVNPPIIFPWNIPITPITLPPPRTTSASTYTMLSSPPPSPHTTLATSTTPNT